MNAHACHSRIARAVVRWFAVNARDLPWRRKRTGYTGLVSEAMLQQTQVARVIDPYLAFMKRFPTVRALAAADEQDVLASWQGLGYYRRARHLHRAARAILADHHGRVPRSVDQLRTLPGVGRYTAGAIASIVFNQHAPLVDGNVCRVLARLFADDSPTDSREFQSWVWHTTAQLVHATDDPGSFNEGLMELGATICTPANPRCAQCPLKAKCLARRDGLQNELPRPTAAVPRVALHLHSVVIQRAGKLLLHQRPRVGLWSSMWQTPTVESPAQLDERSLTRQLQLPIRSLRYLASFSHNTTHRAITLHVYRASTTSRRGLWRAADALNALPISNAHKKVIALALAHDD